MWVEEELHVEEYFCPFESEINPRLYDLILKAPQNTEPPDNINAKMTDWHIECDRLVDWVAECIYKDFSIPTGSLKCSEVWGVLYNEGDYTTPHQHSPSLFSFAYYVNAPFGSAPLVFFTTNHKIYPEPGMLVVFESRLKHGVPPNHCKNRCMVSGNFIHAGESGTYGL
jgi:hypothetical protein